MGNYKCALYSNKNLQKLVCPINCRSQIKILLDFSKEWPVMVVFFLYFYFFFLAWLILNHISQCSAIYILHFGSAFSRVWGPSGISRIEPRSIAWKTRALPTILSLWSMVLSFLKLENNESILKLEGDRSTFFGFGGLLSSTRTYFNA